MGNLKTFNITLRYYNLVIQPVKYHHPDCYVELMKKVFAQELSVVTGTDKLTKMRILSVFNDVIYGQLINMTTLGNDNWYDSETDTIGQHPTEPNMYPNAREWDFYFMPENHRMAVVVKRGISWSQFEKYFATVFDKVCPALGYDTVIMNRVTSVQGLEEIYKLDTISTLEIEVSYSNNDNNDAFTTAIDNELKETNVSVLKTKAEATKNNPIILKKEGNSYLTSLVNLSKNNGFTKARGKEGRRVKTVNTRNYPRVDLLKKITDNTMVKSIMESIRGIKED